MFVFDAWAHEGDRLRRTFLECLIGYLEPWIAGKSKGEWSKRLDALGGRSKDIFTESQPRLSVVGSILLLSLLTAPLGLALLTAGLRSDVSVWWGQGRIAPLEMIGLLLALGPVGVVLTCALVTFLTALRDVRGKQLKHGLAHKVRLLARRCSELSAPYLAILMQKVENKRHERITETPDPSSVDFEKTFRELMTDTMGATDRRLVLVLDNLDRVAPDSALSVWATLQTFIHPTGEPGTREPEDWRKRLWVIVPYDRKGLARPWAVQPASTPNMVSTPRPNPRALVQPALDRADDIASHFAEKTFQITFQVPPPVLSDWRRFLLNRLRQALPQHNKPEHEEEFDAIYRLCWIMQNHAAPTPRQLKLFVNQIGTVHCQWQHQFPLLHVAYYILLTSLMGPQELVDSVRDGNLPAANVQPILGSGDDVRACLAALTFNVAPEIALQILLPAQIKNALATGSVEDFANLAHRAGFWEFLENSPLASWLQGDQSILGNAARCVVDSGVLRESPQWKAAWLAAQLREAATARTEWTLDSSVVPGIVALVEAVNDRAYAKDLLPRVTSTALRRSAAAGDEPGHPPSVLANWVAHVVMLLEDLDTKGLSDVYSEGIPAPVGGSDQVTICARLAGLDTARKYWRTLVPARTIPVVVEGICAAVAAGKVGKEEASAIEVLRASDSVVEWRMLADAACARLQSEALPEGEVDQLLSVLRHLTQIDSTLDSAFVSLARGGYVLNHFRHGASADGATVSDCAAWCAYHFMKSSPDLSVEAHHGDSEDGLKLLSTMLTASGGGLLAPFIWVLEQADDMKLPLSIFDMAASSKPFVLACLKLLVDEHHASDVLSAEEFLDRWPSLLSQLRDQTVEAIVEQLSSTSDIIGVVTTQPMVVSHTLLYLRMAQAGCLKDARYVAWCAGELPSLSIDWTGSITKGSPSVLLLLELLGSGIRLRLGRNYADALLRCSTPAVSGQPLPAVLRKHLRTLLEPLTRSETRDLRAGLLAAMSAQGRVSPTFYNLFGDFVSHKDAVIQNTKVVRAFFIPLIKSRQVAGIEWLAGFMEANPTFLTEYRPQAAVKALKKTVGSCVTKSRDSRALRSIRRIADVFHIRY